MCLQGGNGGGQSFYDVIQFHGKDTGLFCDLIRDVGDMNKATLTVGQVKGSWCCQECW